MPAIQFGFGFGVFGVWIGWVGGIRRWRTEHKQAAAEERLVVFAAGVKAKAERGGGEEKEKSKYFWRRFAFFWRFRVESLF